MPNRSTETNRRGTSSRSRNTSKSTNGSRETGVVDADYDLISVLYHSLQGAETIGKYLNDSSDEEVRALLEDVRDTHIEMAQRVKSVLRDRLVESEEENEDDDSEDELS